MKQKHNNIQFLFMFLAFLAVIGLLTIFVQMAQVEKNVVRMWVAVCGEEGLRDES